MTNIITAVRYEEYHFTCGDGCCDTWGVKVWITDENGIEWFYNEHSLEYALELYLGIEFEQSYEGDTI